MYDFAKDQNLLRRAIRNIELEDEAAHDLRVKLEYVKLEMLAKPSTLSGETPKEVAANQEAVESLGNQLKPKKKRNVKKQSSN